MELGDEAENVGHMLNDVPANYLLEFIVAKRIRKGAEVVNDIGMAQSIRIDTDRTGKFILTTAYIENLLLRRRR